MTAACAQCGHEPVRGRCSGCGHWLCVLCPVISRTARIRATETPQACADCRKTLRDTAVQVGEDWPYLPAALVGAGSGQERVTGGATHPSLPFKVDVWDLLVVPERVPYAHAAPVEVADQIGQLPVTFVLGSWIDDWRDVRGLGENGPAVNVFDQTQWLAERTEWACDHHPAVDEYARELRSLASILRVFAGRPEADERPKPIPGVPCPRCRHVTLTRHHDGDVSCQHPDCSSVWREAEYDHLMRAVAGAVRRTKAKEAA